MWIFDRYQPNHLWCRALAELRKSPYITNEAVGQNWQMDHRVSKAREDELLHDFPCDQEPDGPSWLKGLESYFSRHLCCPWADHPASQPANANNYSHERVAAYDQLLHVASLNRTLGFLVPRVNENFKMAFESLTGKSFPDRQNGSVYQPPFSRKVDAIAASLHKQGANTIRQLAALLSEELGVSEPLWWASFAQELMKLLEDADGGKLCKALGLAHICEGEWLIVWRYRVADAGHLLRPTVIEANTSPFHHVSPPNSAWGITMPLTADLPLCREVQHPPLRGEIAATACTGKIYRVTNFPEVYNEVDNIRRKHRQRLLEDALDETTEEWLRRHQNS